LPRDVAVGGGDNAVTIFIWGVGGTALLKFERVKTPKIRWDLGQLLSLNANISRTNGDIDKQKMELSSGIPL